MQAAPSHPPARPFFLQASPGKRFCLYHPPQGATRGMVLHLPAHAEEMNKSRRMVACQSRLLAQHGFGVLQLDLYGCGDSEGDAGDARWEIWRADVACALDWMRMQADIAPTLWGLRLGALLALDVAQQRPDLASLLLWQPVTDGAAYLTQFLRLKLAADMLAAGKGEAGGVDALRRRLGEGAMLEIAGYALTPALAAAIDAATLAGMVAPACPLHWLDTVPQAGRGMAPARAAAAARCVEQGWQLLTQTVQGPAFWSSQEIAEAPALLDASLALLAGETA
ncbi:hydrolase 2, exosortase A system-associated [Noviherbaspirillum soli]|uniref:hydrolase 2, exosortase A system-associated n=1 Tax=Noviherbaspirillum soli TaxID=1064518 RepID=UPI00188D663B|nr:hydrolase 2, exosortase A system-associated [Noviherbaspirillum soli]